jgi:hypothetical protein
MSEDITEDIRELTEKITTAVEFPSQMVTECMEQILKTDALIQNLARDSRHLTLVTLSRVQMLITEMGDTVQSIGEDSDE